MSIAELHAEPEPALILTDEWLKRSMAMAVPGARWSDARKAYVVDELTPRGSAVICRLFPHLAADYPELEALRDTLLRDSRPFDNATPFNQHVGAPNVREQLAAAGSEFYNFQSIDLGYIAAVMRRHQAAEIAWERGLGKTLAACALIDELVADRVMIVCPNTAKLPVWEAELKLWLPDRQVFIMPNGPPAKRNKMLDQIANTHEPFVLITHYEALNIVAATKAQGKGWHRFGEMDLVVCDESHRLANPKTKQHRALKKVPAAMRLSLTGSMIMNHPEEIYGRLNWMFPKNYTSKWRDWNDRFLEYVESGYGKVLIGPKPETTDALRQELGVFTVYRRKADELDLPDKTEQTLRVDISPAQRAAYNELRDSFVATLDSGEEVVALQPVVQLTRLRQVATGLSLVSREVTDSSKLDLAVELVRDNPDDPFVIFSWFKTAAKDITDRLRAAGEVVHLVTGDTPHAHRATAIRDFQGGRGRVFVGTISTLGESVNLHRASQAIFLDRSWNPAQNEQAADRIYRIGQKNPVTITYIVARDTVDELNVLPTLNTKESIRRMILGGL